MRDGEYDFLYKIVLIGDSGVGKTNLLSRWIRNEFKMNTKSTIGVEFATKTINYDESIIKAQIWDTAGQERYRAITSAYYRGAVGALLVFDITNQKSFKNIQLWIDELHNFIDNKISIILIGNKIDLSQNREVTLDNVNKFIAEKNIMYVETSALNGENIDEAFHQLIIRIYQNRSKLLREKTNCTVSNPIGTQIVKIDSIPTIVNKNKCCNK